MLLLLQGLWLPAFRYVLISLSVKSHWVFIFWKPQNRNVSFYLRNTVLQIWTVCLILAYCSVEEFAWKKKERKCFPPTSYTFPRAVWVLHGNHDGGWILMGS